MNRFNTETFKLGLVLSILFITACSSTPKQASADMTGVNVSSSTSEIFRSKHGCFGIKDTYAKKEMIFTLGCFGDAFVDGLKFGFSFGLAEQKIEKIDNEIFIDVFNEFKNTKHYLKNCSPTDLIRLDSNLAELSTVTLLYKCEDD